MRLDVRLCGSVGDLAKYLCIAMGSIVKMLDWSAVVAGGSYQICIVRHRIGILFGLCVTP